MTGQQAGGQQGGEARWKASYSWWGAVPGGLLASRTQLANADLPREPGGPVRSWVRCRDWRGKRDEVALYAVAESVPTKATGGQLASAAARRTAVVRCCEECGAISQHPLTERDGQPLCLMCHRVARVRERQEELARAREGHARWAAGLLADEASALVWVTVVEAPLTESGRRRPPLAARVHAVDGRGRRLVDVLVRLAGPRAAGVPEGAMEPAEGAEKVQKALSGRRRVVWDREAWRGVLERLEKLGCPVELATPGAGRTGPATVFRGDLPSRVREWRGDLDPATMELRPSWSPGSADRLWFLLTQMAVTAA